MFVLSFHDKCIIRVFHVYDNKEPSLKALNMCATCMVFPLKVLRSPPKRKRPWYVNFKRSEDIQKNAHGKYVRPNFVIFKLLIG